MRSGQAGEERRKSGERIEGLASHCSRLAYLQWWVGRRGGDRTRRLSARSRLLLQLWLLGLLGETWWDVGWCDGSNKEVVGVVRTLEEDDIQVVGWWFVMWVLEQVEWEIRCR
jgi:hypothetical protein